MIHAIAITVGLPERDGWESAPNSFTARYGRKGEYRSGVGNGMGPYSGRHCSLALTIRHPPPWTRSRSTLPASKSFSESARHSPRVSLPATSPCQGDQQSKGRS